MWKKINEMSWDVFIGWIFTPQGVALFSSVTGMLGTILVFFTKALKPFSPFSYFLAFLICLILMALILRTINRRTRVLSLIEYDIVNGEIKLQKTANIFDQRTFVTSNNFLAIFISFNAPIYPSSVVHLDALRGNPPKIEKQFVNEKGAVVFMTVNDFNCTFRLVFNKNYD